MNRVSHRNSSMFTRPRETCRDLLLLAHKRKPVRGAGVCPGDASQPALVSLLSCCWSLPAGTGRYRYCPLQGGTATVQLCGKLDL